MDNLLINILTAAVTSIFTAAFAYWGFWRQAKAELEKEYQKRFNEKKWNTYTEFTISLRKMLEKAQARESESLSFSIDESLMNLATELLLVGSDDVVKAFRNWRTLSTINGPTDVSTLNTLFSLINEMRKDPGIKTSDLFIEDMLGSLIPNYRRSL